MITTILFDFDGVLLNSSPHTIFCVQEVFRKHALSAPTNQEIQALEGLPITKFFESLLSKEQGHLAQAMSTTYQEIATATFDQKVELYPEVIPVLDTLKQHYTLGLVTSRRRWGVQKAFERFELTPYFAVVIDHEDVSNHKPDPEGLLKALSILKALPKQTLYVGDAASDIEAAHNAGIKGVLLTQGIEKHSSDYQISQLSGLPKLIQSLHEL